MGKRHEARVARHFSVIVEDLLAQFKVFGEALQGLREHMDCRFDGVDREILLLKDASLTHTRELKEVNHQLREIRTSVDRVTPRRHPNENLRHRNRFVRRREAWSHRRLRSYLPPHLEAPFRCR